MTFKCDPQTRAELSGAISKIHWGQLLNTALGNDRRIRCFRDANASAADPFATGIEFRNVGSTGALKIAGGRVVGLGKIKGTTVSSAADVSTGKSIVRIEGNGRWIEGTLGTIPGAYDFLASTAFTATNGLAIKPDFALSGHQFLASGTGPTAPELTSDAPAFLRIISYANESSPTTVGTVAINVRDLDMVMDHPTLAAEMGDVRVMRVADNAGIVMGTGGDCFRFSATVFVAHKGLNAEDATKPVYQCLVGAVPHNRWASYPFRKDFNIANDTLSPQPFKAQLLRADMSVLHTWEMYSTRTNNTPGTGKPINYVGQTTNWYQTPVKPWWTCQMMLPYQSHKLKRNSKANHFLPGVKDDALHPTNVAAFDAAPEQWPIITGNYLANGLGSWRMSPKWSQVRDGAMDTSVVDPYFSQPYRDNMITQAIGYGYEPGSTCHHIWFMSPGGSRHDRAPWPHVLVHWASDPTAIRPHGNVPLEELKDQWLLGYFNEGCHYHTNLERGITIPREKILNGLVCYNDTYYSGGNEDFVEDVPNNAIRLLTAMNAQHENWFTDKNGRSFANEYQRDNQHSYSNAAVGVYLMNSPMHAIGARSSFNSHVLCAFGMTKGGYFNPSEFLTRQHAWHMWQHSQMWIATSNDARSITRAELEAMWEKHLSSVYDSVYNAWEKDTGPQGAHLRNLGSAVESTYYDRDGVGYVKHVLATDSKAFYMGQALLFMKQSGSWAAMRARSVKCQRILDLMVTCLAKQSVDCFLDSGARIDHESFYGTEYRRDSVKYPAHWGEYIPAKGQMDFIRNSDGSINGGYIEGFNTQHFRAQMVWIIRDFFPEFNYPRLAEAVALVDGYYNTIEQRRLANTGDQWHWRFAMMGQFKKPAVIGAPT